MIAAQGQIYLIDQGKEYFIHRFDSDFDKIDNSFLEKGDGPNQFKNTPLVFTNSYNNFLNIIELSRNEVYQLNIENGELEELVALPESLGLINQAKNLGKNQIIGKAGNTNGNIFYYDFDNKTLKATEYTPILTQSIKESDKKFVYNSFIETNQKSGIVVEAMQYFDVFNFYDSNGDIINSIGSKEHQKFYEDNEGSFSGPNTKLHYVDVTGDENFCYALYLGKSTKAANSQFKSVDMIIRIFSWTGDYINSFKLNKLCTSITA
ncbi:BF3164 family lipoprotein [Marivirga sp.]|uniref:BF3164 family lipoprotein n=1 Tax=Marivirga sp. TaxID=2018662 RepID=UPI002D80D858|nr:BF3164 family lipoprotein [Marivirga sp.]HET8859748.1 BF3164 family lipoprotein [Marivirga sp.]